MPIATLSLHTQSTDSLSPTSSALLPPDSQAVQPVQPPAAPSASLQLCSPVLSRTVDSPVQSAHSHHHLHHLHHLHHPPPHPNHFHHTDHMSLPPSINDLHTINRDSPQSHLSRSPSVSPNTSRHSLNSSPNGSQFLLPSRIAALSSNLILCKNRWKQLTKGLRSRAPSASLLNQQSKNCIEALQSHQKCSVNRTCQGSAHDSNDDHKPIDSDYDCKESDSKKAAIECKASLDVKSNRKKGVRFKAKSKSTESNSNQKLKKLTSEDLKEQNLARTLKSVDCKDLTLMQILALKSLEFTVPATALVASSSNDERTPKEECKSNDREELCKSVEWVQLAGHQQAFTTAPVAGRIWKRNDRNELRVYERLFDTQDPITEYMPRFYRVVTCSQPAGQQFIELQDLLQQFHNPRLMDIKMGCRTFLEEEVINRCARPDLYEKLIKIDPGAATSEEHSLKAITKLRYMMFRENMSSSSTLGFRIEAFRCGCNEIINDFKYLRRREDVQRVLQMFLPSERRLRQSLLDQLRQLRLRFEQSEFFARHELIGSSLLIIHDSSKVGVWMIDFAKTLPLPGNLSVDHRREWSVGNHEDGYLRGLTNLIELVQQLI